MSLSPTSWGTGSSSGGGETPGAVVATKATFAFDDFADQGSHLGRTPVAYTLGVGEQLLLVGLLITEAFNDSGFDSDTPTFFVASAAVAPFGSLVGPAGYGEGPSVAADAIFALFSLDAGDGLTWDAVSGPIQAETPPLQLFVAGNPMGFDGTTGIIEATFYTSTPTT